VRAALLLAVVTAAACGSPKPPAAEPSKAVQYVSGLQADVKLAQDAKDKADAANKKAREAEKLPE